VTARATFEIAVLRIARQVVLSKRHRTRHPEHGTLIEIMTLTERSQLRRYPNRGSHEYDVVNSILDGGFLAHVGFNVDGQPFVIPTLYGREGEKLYLHGSAASRMMRQLETGMAACVTVTLVDGLVLARSAFHHSMNYRSVTAFGVARKIAEPDDKRRALQVISEHLIAGRWNDVRGPAEKELKATTVLEFSIEEASAKVRTGPPIDDEEDYSLPVWAGVFPIRMEAQAPIPDARLAEDSKVPGYVANKIGEPFHDRRDENV
jgi:uncharacterized protein